MDNLFKIPATLTKYQGMSHRSARMVFDTQENLTDDQIAKIASLHEKFVWLVVLHEEAKKDSLVEAISQLPPLVKEDGEKSKGTVLRACFYRLWEQKGKDGDFELFYKISMDKLINMVKEQLN